jgi:putative transposase
VSDTLVCSRRIRILAVVDDFTRENLALVVDTSLSGARVARELDAIIAVRGRPLMIVSDNGTELTSLAILRWAQDRQIEWHYIRCATSCTGSAGITRRKHEPLRTDGLGRSLRASASLPIARARLSR